MREVLVRPNIVSTHEARRRPDIMTLKLEPSRRLDLLKHAGILSVAVVLLGFGSCSKTNDKTNLVGPTPVASVAVSPGSATIAMAGSVSLTATPKNASGGTLSGRVVTWSSDNTAAATVNGSGLVSGVAAGSATITATCEGKSSPRRRRMPAASRSWAGS
ncbi:MAG: Ig-like domain-containing protein [Candidatus Eisenbacteria bacterium]|uniref:Ig-like domain-containing protein n=1 Tax=Eiseniibacteriota bacterium TaxID=2212470 RepID=A0A538TT62_UNCEI|nr:MAG: Ig-like domain-containing protein [Candidatus Eisenbacteria bacterium]